MAAKATLEASIFATKVKELMTGGESLGEIAERSGLTPGTITAIVDRYLDGLSWDQVADKHGVSYQTVFSSCKRARKRLSKEGVDGVLSSSTTAAARPSGKLEEVVEIDERGNDLQIVSDKSTRITTIEQLLEHCAVDLDVWSVERYVVNKWEVGSKGEGGIEVEPLFQVKAWLVKKAPTAVDLVVSPLSITVVVGRDTPALAKGDAKVALILTDPQMGFYRDMTNGAMTPFHDRLAMDAALQIAQSIKPDKIVWLGDLMDFPTFTSKFPRIPSFYWTVQSAVVEAAWWLAQFAATAEQSFLIEGNHDKRLDTYMLENMVAGYGLKAAHELTLPPSMSVPRLLGLHDIGVEYVGDYPNGRVWLNEHLVCQHGSVARAGVKATVQAVVNSSDVSVIHGHIHRREAASRTIHGMNGIRVIDAMCPGCLCDISGMVPGRSKTQQWQQGIAIVTYTEDNFDYAPIRIHDGKCLAGGYLVEGRDRRGDIVADTGWTQI